MKLNSKSKILVAGVFSLALSFLAPGTRAEAPPLPKTAVGAIGQKLLDAVNSDQPGAIERFVQEHIVPEPGRQMTREKFRALLAKLQSQSGDLAVERIFMADDRNLRLLVSSAKASRKVGLEIVLPSSDSTQASWFWVHHFPGKHPSAMPKEPLDQRGQIEAIKKFLDESASLGVHSGAVLVARGDTILLDQAWGFAHSTTKIPNTTAMQFGTASVGKMFTGVAIAQLKQAGKLDYNDTIAKHLPDYPNKEVAQKVRVQHLLAHTGGLGDPFDSPKLANSKDYKRHSDWFETFAHKPLAFEPGARHEYSNGGYIVLAAIVEKLSGLSFTEYLRKNVFDPAGMRNTGLTTASEKLPVSVPHAVTILEDPLGIHGPQPKAAEKIGEDGVGMGGWTSTTHDLFKFARALRSNKLLNEANTREITTGKVSFIPPPMDVKYCYGFYEMPVYGDRMVGHSGGGGDFGMGAEVEILWNYDYTVVLLSNQGLEEARFTTHTIARFLASQKQSAQVARNSN